jgi:hypothetical protein
MRGPGGYAADNCRDRGQKSWAALPGASSARKHDEGESRAEPADAEDDEGPCSFCRAARESRRSSSMSGSGSGRRNRCRSLVERSRQAPGRCALRRCVLRGCDQLPARKPRRASAHSPGIRASPLDEARGGRAHPRLELLPRRGCHSCVESYERCPLTQEAPTDRFRRRLPVAVRRRCGLRPRASRLRGCAARLDVGALEHGH